MYGITTVQCSSLFLYPSNTIGRAFTVSGDSILRCAVIITVTYWVNRVMGHGSTSQLYIRVCCAMLRHSFVPSDFKIGIIKPI